MSPLRRAREALSGSPERTPTDAGEHDAPAPEGERTSAYPDQPFGEPPPRPPRAEPGELRRSMRDAADRIQRIIDSAERIAEEIRRDAEAEAEIYLTQRRREADELLSGHVELLSRLARELEQRAETLRSEANGVVAAIDAATGTIREAVAAEGLRAGASPTGSPETTSSPEPPSQRQTESWPEPEPEVTTYAEPSPERAESEPPPAVSPPVDPEPRVEPASYGGRRLQPSPAPHPRGRTRSQPPPSEPPPAPAEPVGPTAEPEPEPEREPEPDPVAPVAYEPAPAPEPISEDAARLRATQMAVAGSRREEIETTLRDELGIEDPTRIVDEILGPGRQY